MDTFPGPVPNPGASRDHQLQPQTKNSLLRKRRGHHYIMSTPCPFSQCHKDVAANTRHVILQC